MPEPTADATTVPADVPLPEAPAAEIPDAEEAAPPDDAFAALLDFGDDGVITVKLRPPLDLPRPNFRQIQQLIRLNGKVTDILNGTIDKSLAFSHKAMAEAKEASEAQDGAVVTEATLGRREEVREEARKIAEEADTLIADMLGQWWTLVFELLVTDESKRPTEDAWPSWFMDAKLPNRMVQHWRFVPRSPG